MQNSDEYSLFLRTIDLEREEPTVMRMHLCFSPAGLRGGAGETGRAREAARQKSRVAEKRGAARWRPTSGPGFLLPAGVAPGGVEPSRRDGVGRAVLPLCLYTRSGVSGRPAAAEEGQEAAHLPPGGSRT